MIERITEEELEFLECWFNPVCLAECLFHNFDNLSSFSEDKFGNIRLYQIPALSFESMIDTNVSGLNEKEKFDLRKGAGDVYNVGGRGYGKSLITLKIDITLSALYDDGMWCAFTSIDEKRIRSILDPVKSAMEFHPIVKTWKFKCNYKPDIKFESEKTHWKLNGVNMTLQGRDPGGQWFSLHVEKIWGDEMSFETEEVYKKRVDAYSERGAVIRLSGMTNFTRTSPLGRVFYDLSLRPKLLNLPQFVSPFWTKATKKEKVKEHGGSENTINYRVFVKGEVVEEGIAVFDCDRVRKCYLSNETIKRLEVAKKDYAFYKEILVVNRPSNAEQMLLACDIGESAPCEIVLVMRTKGNKYRYLYNITLRNMSNIEIQEIIKWLIEYLKIEVVGIDCGDGTGRAVSNFLEKELGIEVVRYDGSGKVPVDILTDKHGNPVFDRKGEPVYRMESMSEWAINRLKNLFYEGKLVMPIDDKFDLQMNSVVAVKSGMRTVYKCLTAEDHLFDAFKVLAIAVWMSEFNPNSRKYEEIDKNFLLGGVRRL